MLNFRFKATVSAVIMLITSACSEDSPFISKKEAEQLVDLINTERDPFHAMKNVVAIINNDVYYFNRMDTIPRRLTQTPASVKTDVKLSFDKTQIAYINAAGNPVIIRSDNGQVLQTLTQFDFITQMDWAKDRLTLYMLIDKQVVFYGEPLEVTQPASAHPWDDVSSFSMNSIGDQGYFIQYYNGSYGKKLNYYSEEQDIDEEYSSFDGVLYDYIDFYDNKGNFLLGYKDSYDGSISRIICIQDYNFWGVYEWDYENMNTPEFNADHEILLYGTMENQEYTIKAVYQGTDAYPSHGIYDRLTKTLIDYPSETPVYLDWVQ